MEHKDGQAGAETEIEITPAMIEAGRVAAYAADDELLGYSSEQTVEHMAVAAYVAMERARLNGQQSGEYAAQAEGRQ